MSGALGIDKISQIEERVGHLEIVVSSVNTTLTNVQSDVVRLTTAIDTLISSKETNWGVIASIFGVALLIIAGYWTLAKQPYDIANKNFSNVISILEKRSVENKIEIARLKEQSKWKK